MIVVSAGIGICLLFALTLGSDGDQVGNTRNTSFVNNSQSSTKGSSVTGSSSVFLSKHSRYPHENPNTTFVNSADNEVPKLINVFKSTLGGAILILTKSLARTIFSIV